MSNSQIGIRCGRSNPRQTTLIPRRLQIIIVWLLAASAGFFITAARADTIIGVDAIGITVDNMETAVAFYTEVLPFHVVSDREVAGPQYERLFGVFGMRARIVRLALGDEHIELIDFQTVGGRPNPTDSRSNDEWFQHIAIIVSDMDKAYALLREQRIAYVSPAPQRLPDWNSNAAGIKAFYFRDPDGNNLEILEFPPGKGNSRWHEKSERLFLGIDHTAIVVHDTESELRFYRDGLGMKVNGESENYGIEQERLNSVFGARLRITSLSATTGPAVEFLEYLSPRNGRPMPRDTQANDLWHTQIHFAADRVSNVPKQLSAYGGALVSPGVVRMDSTDPFPEAVLGRDPTGHAVLIYSTSGAGK